MHICFQFLKSHEAKLDKANKRKKLQLLEAVQKRQRASDVKRAAARQREVRGPGMYQLQRKTLPHREVTVARARLALDPMKREVGCPPSGA